MEKSEKDKLVQELNQLSSNFEKNKERMVEIAKILLSEHYWWRKKEEKKSDLSDVDVEDKIDDEPNIDLFYNWD